MEHKLKKILDDYRNCINMRDCASCKAWNEIPNTETTWCEFLREHNEEIYNKIAEVLGR